MEYRNYAPGIPSTEAVVPAGISPCNYMLDLRNSFYWDKRAMALAPGALHHKRVTGYSPDSLMVDQAECGTSSLAINSTSCSFVRAGGSDSPARSLRSGVSRLIAPCCQAATEVVSSLAPRAVA